MNSSRITKRLVDSVQVSTTGFVLLDSELTGFGLRVRPSGARSYIVVYRADQGRKAPVRKVTIGAVGKCTPDQARMIARQLIGSVAHGRDPATERAEARSGMTVADLAEIFMIEHVGSKRKPGTAIK